jgi:peptide deformylase
MGRAAWQPPGKGGCGAHRYIDRISSSPYIAAMARRDILILPDKRLRLVSEPVGKIDSGIRTLVEDMFESMYEAPGIGLAAVQVGSPIRVVTMDLAKKDDPKNPQVFINPEILWASEETIACEEGCLSVPGVFDMVRRPARVRVRAMDVDGKPFERDCQDMLAVCVQHEMDHLEGRMFVEYLSTLKQERIRSRMRKRHARRA